MFERLSTDQGSTTRIAGGWIVVGLLLIALMGVSFSDEPQAGPATTSDAAAPEEVPTYAIDEDLPPLGAG